MVDLTDIAALPPPSPPMVTRGPMRGQLSWGALHSEQWYARWGWGWAEHRPLDAGGGSSGSRDGGGVLAEEAAAMFLQRVLSARPD